MAPESGAGIYVHIPFCRSRCGYCDFFSMALSRPPPEKYLRHVLVEGRRQRQRLTGAGSLPATFSGLYVGGGTPTVYPVRQLATFLEALQDIFALAPEAEVTVETNPGLLDAAGLALLRSAGVTRLSVGLQSFDPRLLALVGRKHAAAPVAALVDAAGAAGMETNLDLIFGLPGQSLGDWEKDLERALALRPDHLSVYELSVEAGTPLAKEIAGGVRTLPEEDEVFAMMAAGGRALENAGLQRYEISNYARPGRQCRHNVNYWENGEYLGLGAGAVSSIAGRRWKNICQVQDYGRMLGKDEDPACESEKLGREESFRETVVLGLRMLQGVEEKSLERRFGIRLGDYYAGVLEPLIKENLVVFRDGRLRLSPRGLELANRVMALLV